MQKVEELIQRKPKLSKTYYVNAQGELCKRETFMSKKMQTLSLICKKTPFLVLWIASVLILVEIVSLVRCCQLLQNPSLETSNGIRNNLALVILIGIILAILGKVSLFFTYQSSKVGGS